MRVEVVESFAEKDAALALFSDAAVERAQKNFFAALASDDSLFTAESSGCRLAGGSAESQKACRGTLAVRFRDESYRDSRRLYFSLIEKLTELLKAAGSMESLGATLGLAGGADKEPKAGLALWIRLEAQGSSAEQVGLRWGLGLAHIQQALLFMSRYLRQQIGQNGD